MSREVMIWLQNGVTIAVLISLILTHLAEGRKSIADFLGPPGRWIRQRAERREALRKQNENADYKALQRQIVSLEKTVHRLEGKIEKLEKGEKENAMERDRDSEFIRQDARHHHIAKIAAAEQQFDLPSHVSYTEFCHEWNDKHRHAD